MQLPSVSESESEFTLSLTSLIIADLVMCDDMDITTGAACEGLTAPCVRVCILFPVFEQQAAKRRSHTLRRR